MSLHLRFAARSDVGLLRDGNEDAMYAGPRLLAVADGMGGHAAGEVASRVVIESVARLDGETPDEGDVPAALHAAVDEANGYLRQMVAADSALEGMGTTLTALLWTGQRFGLVHVGDSRAYLLRDGDLRLITHDHTLVQNLIDEGRLSPDDANTHPQRSWITRALDGRSDLEADVSMRDVRPGDRYLVCSDGLSGYVSEETIGETLAGSGDPQQACDRLVELALRAGGPDNVTCIVADVFEGAEDAGRADPAAEPIVGGAAADDGPSRRASAAADSPAARAAELGATTTRLPSPPAKPAKPAEPDIDSNSEDSDGGGRHSGRIVLIALASVIVLVGLGAGATFLYVRTQFYVGASAAEPKTLTIYQGVSGSFLGIELSRTAQTSDVPVGDLPDYEQSRVGDGIPASSRADAVRIMATLRQEACAAKVAAARQVHQQRRRPASGTNPPAAPAYCTAATGAGS